MTSYAQVQGNSLPNLYADGCQISVATATTATIAAGQVRDSTNGFDIAVPAALTLNMAANGANGLDTGTVAASSVYYVYVIYDVTQANPSACLASLSATVPLMPSLLGVTFSSFRLVGVLFTDGSSELLPFDVSGTGNVRYMQWHAPISVLSGGNAVVDTDIDLSAAIPSSNYGPVQIQTRFDPNAGGATASIRSFASASYQYTMNGVSAGVLQSELVELLPTYDAAVPTFTYALSSASSTLDVSVTGFELVI